MTTRTLSQGGMMYMAPAIAAVFMTALVSGHAQVNTEINKSLWKQKYGVLDAQLAEQPPYAGWLSLDADGDGVINGAELAAGTNPFLKLPADAHFRAPAVTVQTEDLSLEFPTVPGKFYQAESSDELAAWIAGTLPGTAGDGGRKTLVVPKGAGNFFRVRVSDQSSHGDQVSDWAKLQLGFSLSAPLATQTSYHPASLAASLEEQNAVSLGVIIGSGTQPADPSAPGEAAVVRISRSGAIVPGEITVPLSIGGTAIPGTDYTALPTSVTFPPGVNSVELKVTPRHHAARTHPITVNVTALAPDQPQSAGNYRLGSPAFGAVTIYPSGAANGTGLTAQYFKGASSTYTNILNFGGQAMTYAYVRNTGNLTGSATITYSGSPATPITEGSQVLLQFTSGNLNTAAFNVPKTYTVVAPVTATTFKVNFSGTTALPANGSGNLSFGNFSEPLTGHSANIDATYLYGSANGVATIGADNYSVRWETYLAPGTGNYTFQLDADDKARVLLYLDGKDQPPTEILQNGWSSPATGGFKQSAAIPLEAPATAAGRYRMVVEFVEATGAAKCRLQWRLGSAAYANIPAANAFRDDIAATTGWTGKYYNNTTFTEPPATTQFDSAVTLTSNGDWGIGTPHPDIGFNNFTVRWTGQVLPQYSQKYYFVPRTDDGSRLWVNDQLIVNRWTGGLGEGTGSIDLKAGVFYDIVLEYYEGTGSAEAHLSWYSADQAKQIIPSGRLFPAPAPSVERDAPIILAAPAITSSTDAVAVMNAGTPFTMDVTSSNSGVITSDDLPSWLTLVNGVLSGIPPAPGIYQFTLTTTNEAGSSSVIMTLEVLAAEGMLTRETWNATGPMLSDVPWHAASATSDTVAIAEDNDTGYSANTGERLRGYFIAPATGNYYFWIAASNVAELWISNDHEPVNKVLRATVTGPAGTGPRIWDAQPSQKSPWLSLVGGQKYYFEALHNTGASGASNHLAVGWAADSTGTTANLIENGSGVLPAHALSPWDNPPTTTTPGTLYVTNLQAVEGLGNITATGGAFLRVSGGGAILQLDHAGLTSGITSRKLYNGDDQVIFDVGEQEKKFPALRTSDGGYSLQISGSDLEDLNHGRLYVKIATVNHPDGEISGTFGKVDGSQAAPQPPAYPAWADEHASNDGANSRFLTQATFGPHPDDMAYVKANGYRAWIENQFGIASTKNVPNILGTAGNNPEDLYNTNLLYNSWWKNAVTAPDQLRQRAAFALSQVFVVSNSGPLNNNSRALGTYYDMLLDGSFGNFRELLKGVTLSPAMGVYLDMRGNSAGSIANGTHPNENYAREILQLFSAGLYRVWPDGTLVLGSDGLAIPTYDQEVITGFARVFTGWSWSQALPGSGRLPGGYPSASNYLDPMVHVPSRHELGAKILLDNVVLPAAVVTAANSTLTEPGYPVQFLGATQGNPVTATITNSYDLNGIKDLERSFDNIVNNPAVAPYICRQLIQRLVTSHPKPDYVHRVVRAFNGEQNVDGVATGIKGDMKEVFRAILLDYEARSETAATDPTFGKQREPLLRITGPARTFPASPLTGSTYRQSGLNQILVTTPTPHRLINSDTIRLADFVDSGASTSNVPATASYTVSNTVVTYSLVGSTAIATITAPGFQAGDTVAIQFAAGLLGSHATFKTLRDYTVVSATPTNFTVHIGDTSFANVGNTSNGAVLAKNFTVNALNYVSGGYTSTGGSVVISSGGFITGHQAYVRFSSGGLAGGAYDGVYTVTAHTSSNFTIALSSTPASTTGTALVPRFAGGYNITASGADRNIDVYCTGAHNLAAGDGVYINFLTLNGSAATAAPDALYTITEIRSKNVFRIKVTGVSYNTGDQNSSGMLAYPLSVPTWVRNGTVTVNFGNWNVNSSGGDLGQTPLNSPTVFNFFYPDYRFPGEIAKAGMTTPEFQLTNDSSVMNLTNVITTSIINPSNTNGYGSFRNTGTVMFDFSSYMTPEQTSATGIPALVDRLATLMTGRTLSADARTTVINYVSNPATGYFPIGSPPTKAQMRDRVRAIIHLIATSAEYAIQK